MSETNQSTTESISAELRIGSENLRFSVEITNEPVHIHDLLPFFQQITDKVIEIGVKEAEQQGKCISCKKGCGACCSQLVPVSRAEGYKLLNLIESMPAERQQVIRARFAQNINALKDAGILQMMEQAVNNNDRKQLREVGVNYFRLNLPCPFLEDQSCSIHRDRPLSCREFLVTSDPVHCADTNPETVESLSLPKRISPIIYKMSRDLNEAGRGYLALIQILDSTEVLSSNQANEPAIDLIKQFLQNLTQS
ncbi:MAG: YkgJ family cysteine cluster protein [Candidatus Thiodiazotropha weberae]|nr:YkgJ family cysteine cluster protein [Candidatus Thiodiazotropha lotti]MCG8011827.1 YkgJ family cysteine cluster protein [Candidatus Thiodiazotropha lotti]MCG8020640.1 YkgJ family cysteine cluster protein [Candidatus Thiodiazotropha lotti]MCW4207803.1 YkgJ family cysteine cluster protein [Candidatus Thiodiazotropha lotti]MCW4211294.1 YkgJ family cysteine cluster protein [Candidatus Thiodiazotropha lotti]